MTPKLAGLRSTRLICVCLGMLCSTAARTENNADALTLDFLRYLVEFHQADQWIDPEVLVALDALPAAAKQDSSLSTLSKQQPPETPAEVTP